MFYSTDILVLRGKRKLARIWLAAMLSEKMFKQKCKLATIIQIDVAAACIEILSSIEGRGSSVRFSLYLSAQLMYGVTKILYYQAMYLQESVFNEICNLHLRGIGDQQPHIILEIPEPPALALPLEFMKDEHLIIQEPYPIAIEHLMHEEPNFGVLNDEEFERVLMHDVDESLEIRGFNWDEQTDVPRRLVDVSRPDDDAIETEEEFLEASRAINERKFLHVEDGGVNVLAPSTPKKRPLRSPSGTPSKKQKVRSVSPARELITTVAEPAPVPEPEIIPEQQSEQQIEVSAVAHPELPPGQQPVDAPKKFRRAKTREIIIDRHTILNTNLMRRNLENVTYQTRDPNTYRVFLPLMLSAFELLTKPAMHMFGTKWGEKLLTFFRQHLTPPVMVPDEFDVPDFDEPTVDEVVRAEETSKAPDATVELSHLTRLEITDPSKTLEKTALLLDVGKEPADESKTVEQQQTESLVQLPEITIHEQIPEEAVVAVQKTTDEKQAETERSSSPVDLSKQDLLAQMEVLWSGGKVIKFDELVPRSYTRREAAVAFLYCLELHSEKKIVLKQAVPFDTIWISKYADYSDSEESSTGR